MPTRNQKIEDLVPLGEAAEVLGVHRTLPYKWYDLATEGGGGHHPPKAIYALRNGRVVVDLPALVEWYTDGNLDTVAWDRVEEQVLVLAEDLSADYGLDTQVMANIMAWLLRPQGVAP